MVCPNRAVVVKALRSFAILNDEHKGREAKHLFAHGADGFFLSYTLTSANKITVHVIFIVDYEVKARPSTLEFLISVGP